MRVCVLAGFFACLTSSAPSADDRAGPWPAMPADVIAEEAVGYPQFRKARAVCIGCRAASLPWGRLRKPVVAGLPWGGLPNDCPPFRPVRRVVITTKG
jgi:hypothetical protein